MSLWNQERESLCDLICCYWMSRWVFSCCRGVRRKNNLPGVIQAKWAAGWGGVCTCCFPRSWCPRARLEAELVGLIRRLRCWEQKNKGKKKNISSIIHIIHIPHRFQYVELLIIQLRHNETMNNGNSFNCPKAQKTCLPWLTWERCLNPLSNSVTGNTILLTHCQNSSVFPVFLFFFFFLWKLLHSSTRRRVCEGRMCFVQGLRMKRIIMCGGTLFYGIIENEEFIFKVSQKVHWNTN